MQTRSSVMVNNAVVTSSQQLASYHGSRVIDNGGNVFDALITTSSVLTVVQNNLCGLGGDLFALLRGPDGRIHDLNGSGKSSINANIDFFKEKGLKELPERGKYSAITTPGLVDSWNEINRKYGSMELRDLLQPAISIAENGYPLTRKYVDSIRNTAKFLAVEKGFSSLFLPGGNVPEEGTVFKQKQLASTLRSIAEEGTETFYRGALMDKIVRGLQEGGGLFEDRDFEKHKSVWREPLKTNYRGVDVYNSYPNSQGPAVTIWLNLLEEYGEDLLSNSEEKTLPVFLETGLTAYRARAMYITDPDYHDLPQNFSSKKFADEFANQPDGEWAASPAGKDKGDTTYFCLTDSEGNSASVIQSNFMGFGSGFSPNGTGFLMQNRGSYFSLDPEHHNSLQPEKRTFHTLLATMGVRDDEMAFIMGTMGGDIQPQINVQMINRIVDRKMDVQDTLDYPRWVFNGTIYEKPVSITAEHSLYERIKGVDTKGLGLVEIPDMQAHSHAQAIVFGKNGGLFAGADPRGDGSAVGF